MHPPVETAGPEIATIGPLIEAPGRLERIRIEFLAGDKGFRPGDHLVFRFRTTTIDLGDAESHNAAPLVFVPDGRKAFAMDSTRNRR